MFAVKSRILKEMFEEKYWREKLEKANSLSDVEQILTEYCKTKGYKVRRC